MNAERKVPRARTSLGPEFTGMTCPCCGDAGMHGLIDVNGRPYVSCEFCRFRALGLSYRGVTSLRFLGNLIAQPTIREAWATAMVKSMATAATPPPKKPTPPVPAVQEDTRGVA